jgi:hypothetical protein
MFKRAMRKYEHIWLPLLSIIVIVALFFIFYNYSDLNDKEKLLEVHLPYYILALIVSIALVLIAYFKSKEAIKQSKTNYLLKLDERWGSREIIRAREVIHRLYLKAKGANKKYSNEKIKGVVANSIMNLHEDKEHIADFISLLNFLDFLETIGYMHSEQAIKTEEVKELMGNSLVYFFDIFKIYIDYRRKEKDPSFYCYIEKLYLEISVYNNKSKC